MCQTRDRRHKLRELKHHAVSLGLAGQELAVAQILYLQLQVFLKKYELRIGSHTPSLCPTAFSTQVRMLSGTRKVDPYLQAPGIA